VNPTSLSSLDRLKVARPDAFDWNRLQGVYFPLIERWLSRVSGLGDESADLAQEVLIIVFREVPRFDRLREGSFRAWLRQVTVNKIFVVNSVFRDRFDAEPAFHLQKQSLDPFPETGR
jgi:hypothetical protein